MLAFQQWLSQQIVPLFLIGFAVLMGVALVFIAVHSRRASLGRKRAGQTADTFSEYLARYGFDPEIARTAYHYLQDTFRISYPLEPTDDLDRDLGLDNDDINQALQDLLQATGREYLPGIIDSPIVQVADLIRYVQASPRQVVRMRRRA